MARGSKQGQNQGSKLDVYQAVTDRILAHLEAGVVPWEKPWTGAAVRVPMPLRVTGEPYRGINVLMLWVTAMEKGYGSPTWMTFKQAKAMGASVRKGETSTLVVKFGTIERKEDQSDMGDQSNNDAERSKRVYARAYRVFNAEQIEGLDESFYCKPEPALDLGTKADPRLRDWFGGMGVEIRISDKPEAYYAAAEDYIHMPPIETFPHASRYWDALAHETVHATKHPSRLDRKHEGKSAQERYAREELVAQLGASMVSAQLGIVPHYDQSAGYLQAWIDVLKEDKRAILRAASQAQAAVDWMFAQAGEFDADTPETATPPATGSQSRADAADMAA